MSDQDLMDDDADDKLADNTYIIFLLNGTKYCFAVTYVHEILRLPEIHPVPSDTPYAKGIVKVRNSIIHVIDLRKLFGMKSLQEENAEFVDMLKVREEEHIKWVTELCASVQEKREFKLTTDPHACAFGKWYESYQSPYPLISNHLKKFDGPHKKIHEWGETIKELTSKNDYEKACELCKEIKEGDLATLRHLFEDLYKLIEEMNKEVAVVCQRNNFLLGLTVDSVDRIAQIQPEAFVHNDTASGEHVQYLTKLDDEIILKVEMETVLHDANHLKTEEKS